MKSFTSEHSTPCHHCGGTHSHFVTDAYTEIAIAECLNCGTVSLLRLPPSFPHAAQPQPQEQVA